jgi:hypothetical protein
MRHSQLDYVEDCAVNYDELDLMFGDWLEFDSEIAPVEPNAAGLLAHYEFEGNANDSSGNGNDLVEHFGPTYAASMAGFGQAVSLDGTDDYLDRRWGVGISGADPRTITGWAKASTTTIGDWCNVFGLSAPSGGNRHFDIEKRGGQNNYCIHVYGWERNIMAVDLEWHHFAASYDGTTIRWYGDGLLRGSDSSRNLNSDGIVRIGNRYDNASYFPGLVDDVRFYNYELSNEEIVATRGLGAMYFPVTSPANVSDDEPMLEKAVNFKDYAKVLTRWLEEQMFE